MKYLLDTHTHTLASGHAYSTIREMAYQASKIGLELIGITEHAPMMPGTCHEFYFQNLKVVERSMCNVELLLGAELNIIDYSGHVDLKPNILRKLDIGIASLHLPCIKPGQKEENTAAYLNVMKNPFINIIGHPDDGRYPIDYKELVKGAREHHVLLEVNNSSLRPDGYRRNAAENAAVMLKYCRQMNVQIAVGSDAHIDSDVGAHEYANKLLKDVDFPQELIVNGDIEMFKSYVNRYKRG